MALLDSMGQAMVDAGEACMDAGIQVWKSSAEIVLKFCTQDPTSFSGVWGKISSVYSIFMGIGATLFTLYFVLGWLRESVDIKSHFSMENIILLYIRFILTGWLLLNAMNLIKTVLRLSGLLAAEVGVNITTNYHTDELFSSLVGDLTGGALFGTGLLCLIGGFIGMMVIIVSGVTLVLSVLTRFFKVFLCIPFAPMALASFAGGHGLSQSGVSWIKTFFAYCLEVVVIALALTIASGFFQNRSNIFSSADGWTGTVLGICNICLPMLTAVSCVKGAEGILRKTLGL